MKTFAGFISSSDFGLLQDDVCPNCKKQNAFAEGPRGGMAQNIVCTGCRMEFNAGPAGAEMISQRCPDERLKEFYKIQI